MGSIRAKLFFDLVLEVRNYEIVPVRVANAIAFHRDYFQQDQLHRVDRQRTFDWQDRG